jgi:hypothetical protein
VDKIELAQKVNEASSLIRRTHLLLAAHDLDRSVSDRSGHHSRNEALVMVELSAIDIRQPEGNGVEFGPS